MNIKKLLPVLVLLLAALWLFLPDTGNEAQTPAATPVPQYQPSYDQSYYNPNYYEPSYEEPYYEEPYYDPYQDQTADPYAQQSADNYQAFVDWYNSMQNQQSAPSENTAPAAQEQSTPASTEQSAPADNPVVDTLFPADSNEGEILPFE